MTVKKNDSKEIEELRKKVEALGVPFINLSGKKIKPEILKEIPEEAAAFYRFIPFGRTGNVLEVGMVEPDDFKAKEALRFIARRSGLETKISLISPAAYEEILKQYKTLGEEVQRALTELKEELEAEKTEENGEEEELIKQISVEAPITKIVAVILRHAVDGRASDVHIEPVEERFKVRFRVDGVLYTSLFLPKEIQAAVISRIKILSNLKIDETRIPQDGRFHTIISGKKIDFRVSILPIVGGEKAVLRVLDPTVGLKTFPELGLQSRNLGILEEGIKKPFGMILLTGPTGSGKTTTLYSILGILNEEGINIISLEDPVEYYIEGVNQSQIRPEIGYTFASGLRHILRQDPDVIMVGEIRDEETAGLAIHAALTGHIVLSTLHTNNAIGVIPRLIDMGVGPFLLPPALNLCIAQRLVKRLCPKCKKEIEASPKITELIEEELAKLDESIKKNISFKKPFKIYRAQGCELCANKGTKGRLAVFEIFKMTPEVEKIINEDPKESKFREEAKRQGMVTMKQDGVLKVLQGVISFEEMLNVVEGEE